MTKDEAVSVLIKKFSYNPILAKSLIIKSRTRDYSPKLLEAISENHLEEKAKPFVKWVGGKRQLLKQFKDLDLYPPDGFDPLTNTYFEPFVGGGAVFLDLLPINAVLSDMNFELVTTYNVVKNNLEKLIKKLEIHKKNNTKEYFLKIRAQNPKKLKDVSVAARFIYLNKTCFNGMYRVNKKGGFNVPYGKYNNPNIVDKENFFNI